MLFTRMNRTTFIFLLELLTPHFVKNFERFGRLPISKTIESQMTNESEKQLLLTIWIIATPDSYK